MLTNVLKDNHHSTNSKFTYRFYFQETPEVSKSKRSIPTKKNVNEYSQRDNHYPTNPRFTYQFHFQENPEVQRAKEAISTKKKEKRMLTNILKETTTTPTTQDSPTGSIFKKIRK